MKYNTKEVYFGIPTYKVSEGDYWTTKPEVFLKRGDKYLRVASKNLSELEKFSVGTNQYVSVSNLCPILNLIDDKKQIPEQISGMSIGLYLMKYKIHLNKKVEETEKSDINTRTK